MLVAWSWMGGHPGHALTGAFYRRFRPLTVRQPARSVRMAATALGASEVALGVLLAIWRPEPTTGVVIALGSVTVIAVTLLIAWIRFRA